MKRYNRGFLKWGPMEHHKDGEWVNFNEAHTFYGNIIDQMTNSGKETASLYTQQCRANQLLEEEYSRIASRNTWLTMVTCVAVFGMVVLAFAK